MKHVFAVLALLLAGCSTVPAGDVGLPPPKAAAAAEPPEVNFRGVTVNGHDYMVMFAGEDARSFIHSPACRACRVNRPGQVAVGHPNPSERARVGSEGSSLLDPS